LSLILFSKAPEGNIKKEQDDRPQDKSSLRADTFSSLRVAKWVTINARRWTEVEVEKA
jgi:hypothetical protein